MQERLVECAFLLAALATGAVGCDDAARSGPAGQPAGANRTAAESPKPRRVGTEERVATIEGCWAALDARDAAKLGACFSERSSFEMMDSVPPLQLRGGQSIVAAMQPFWTAFPDLKHELGMIFLRGHDVVVVYSAHGTNRGPLMGQPPTGKTMGAVSAQHVRFAVDGTVLREEHFSDQSTVLGQLGLHHHPVRPVRELGAWGKPVVVVAKKDKAENANLAAYRKLEQVTASKDLDALMKLYADDALVSFQPSPSDERGKEAIRSFFERWFKMSTDARSTLIWRWAAGPYVLAAERMSGTNDGPLLGGQPATNKRFTLRVLEVVKLDQGRVKEHWMFANGLKLATDLGLANDSEPSEPAAAPADGGTAGRDGG